MLCVWWNSEGIMYFKLVENGAVMSATLSGEQLNYGYTALVARRDSALINQKHALLQYGNASTHTAALI